MSTLTELAAERFLRSRPQEASRVLDAMDPADTAQAIARLEASSAAELLERMGADTASRALSALPTQIAAALMTAADPVRVANWLSLLDEEERERLLAAVPARTARNVREAFEYPAGTAGQLMDARVLAFEENTPIATVIERIRSARGFRILDVLVEDAEHKLAGVVSLQALLTADPKAPLGSLSLPDPPCVLPMASRDQVVELLAQHAMPSLPVVDLDRRIVGILRYNALVRVVQQAATDDLQQMVGAGKEERALSNPWFTVRSRLPWLLINLGTAFAASAVVSLFDATLARFTVLAILMPIVAGQSGNTGAQALAVTSRGLALREIRLAHTAKVVGKEAIAALANGCAIATLTGSAVLVWSKSLGLAAVIASSMVLSMLLAACAGALIPIVLTALKRDPATASSIVLTTITDITGMSSFLGLATLMASYLR